MNTREIAKARIALRNAGTPADNNQLRATLIAHLENDVHTLGEQKVTVRADYRRKLECWRTQEVAENVAVCALPNDIHDTRLYRATALFALLSEMALAAWIFFWQGVVWWIGVLAALGITLTLHGVFLHVFDNPERPKEAIHRIKTLASLPAIFGFLAALAVSLLARYVTGTLAVMLLPVFSLALWLGTLSLLVLAASLFTIAHIQGWSARHERQYRALDHEERVSATFLDELRAEGIGAATSAMQPVAAVQAVGSSTAVNSAARRSVGFLAMAVVAAALSASTGCSTASTSASVTQVAAHVAERTGLDAAEAQTGASLHIFVDTSGSCVRPALDEAWNTVRRELPEIIERHTITKLTVWQFDVDGWSPRRAQEIALPAQHQVAVQRAVTEWQSFANIRNAVREAEERDSRKQAATVKEQYRESLAVALKPLEAEHVLPKAGHETAQTDVVGLLRRIAQTDEREQQYVIILTDLADTRYRTLPKLPSPRSEVRVLVLMVPAQPKDARMTLGKALPGPEQFDIRSRQLQQSASWIGVAPYFAHNLTDLPIVPQTR